MNENKDFFYIASMKNKPNEKPLLFSKIILFKTGGTHFHTEVVIPSNGSKGRYQTTMYSAIVEKNIVRKTAHSYNPEQYDYIKILVTDHEMDIVQEFLESILNAKYDRLGILGFITPIRDRIDKWFCSEISSNVLKILGRKCMWSRNPATIDPEQGYQILLKAGYKVGL